MTGVGADCGDRREAVGAAGYVHVLRTYASKVDESDADTLQEPFVNSIRFDIEIFAAKLIALFFITHRRFCQIFALKDLSN